MVVEGARMSLIAVTRLGIDAIVGQGAGSEREENFCRNFGLEIFSARLLFSFPRVQARRLQ